jgi:hypothetical protein
MPPKPRRCQFLGLAHQLFARLDAVDARCTPGFEEQVVEDETEVGLARAMVDQAHVGMVVQHFLQQRFDELVEGRPA